VSSLQWVQPPANNNTPRRDECETVSAAIYQRSIKTLYLQAFMRSSLTSKAIAFEDRRAKRQRLLDEKEITNTNTYKGLMALLHGCSGSWQLSNHTISKITPGRVIVSFSATNALHEGKYSPVAWTKFTTVGMDRRRNEK